MKVIAIVIGTVCSILAAIGFGAGTATRVVTTPYDHRTNTEQWFYDKLMPHIHHNSRF